MNRNVLVVVVEAGKSKSMALRRSVRAFFLWHPKAKCAGREERRGEGRGGRKRKERKRKRERTKKGLSSVL
jgi:hypothetical protein